MTVSETENFRWSEVEEDPGPFLSVQDFALLRVLQVRGWTLGGGAGVGAPHPLVERRPLDLPVNTTVATSPTLLNRPPFS